MTQPSDPLLRVAASMQAALGDYRDLLRELAGERLLGLTVFGTVLEPEFDPSRMTAASVAVLDRVDLGLLRRIGEKGPTLGRRRITAPLIMTPDYITQSLDTFPLEFLEIQQQRITLWGQDRFADLSFQREHVRLQCERECKRLLLRLRQGLLVFGGRERALDGLGLEIGQHLLRTLRGILWLHGKTGYLAREATGVQCQTLLGQALPAVGKVLAWHGSHGWAEFEQLYGEVESLTAMVDRLGGE